MTFEPIAWGYMPSVDPFAGVPMTAIHKTVTTDGRERFAIRRGRSCLNKSGQWEYEPIPSERDDAFFARCRFNTFDEAADFVVQFCGEGK